MHSLVHWQVLAMLLEHNRSGFDLKCDLLCHANGFTRPGEVA